MSDTQWPRYEVFIQSRTNQPHKNVGSVHAADPEMALQNGRDVFVRRPDCLSLWAVPASEIKVWSAAELVEGKPWEGAHDESSPEQEFLVFAKKTQRQSMTFVEHVGQLPARSPERALKRAIELFSDRPVYIWWICPESAVVRSEVDDQESMFAPALNKGYRMPREYRVLSEMMEAKRQRTEGE